ncbi:MAG: hypothetical protein ACRDUY_08935 [Nitriliruptorales bacterium]
MSNLGEDRVDLLVRARSALLDALDALEAHRASVVVIGAQAIYLRTAAAPVALAEATNDSDLVIDPRLLDDDPRIEAAMERGGFHRNLASGQPGEWMSAAGIPVDLMVPERLAGGGKRTSRGARIPPHDKHATRRARGLEAAVIDNDLMEVGSLAADDGRRPEVRIAGTAALLLAKAHKIGERAMTSPSRLVDKDAHDVYRILVGTETEPLALTFRRLLDDGLSAESTTEAQQYLRRLFAAGPEATGSLMAGRAEEGIGEPITVSRQTSILAADLLEALE